MSGERTPLACWFESLAVALRPLQRHPAGTNLNPTKHANERKTT
jgi:hypothetical protein